MLNNSPNQGQFPGNTNSQQQPLQSGLTQKAARPAEPNFINQTGTGGRTISQALSAEVNQQLKQAAGQMMGGGAKIQPDVQRKEALNRSPGSGSPKTSKESKKQNRKFVLALIVTAVMLLPMPKQVGGDVEISGAASVNQALIRPSVNGTLKEIFVKTGQEVRSGEIIATLRNWEIEEKILEGEKQVNRLKASLATVDSQVRVAREEYERLKEDYNRQKAESDYIQGQAQALNDSEEAPPRIEATRRQLQQIKLQAESMAQKASLHKYLADEGVFPKQSALQSAYEAASAAKQVEALTEQLKAEEAELKQRSKEDLPKLNEALRASNANKERYESAKTELRSIQIQLAEANRQLEVYNKQKDELVLKSPIDGQILTLKTDLLLGQNFNRGDTVAVVGNLSQVKINIQLPEEDRALVQKGQKVTARIRAIPDTVFSGRVESIAPVTSETGEQTSKRKIWDISMVLDNPKGKLNPGMTGYAKIHTGTWSPMIFLAWDEVYKAFRLDRYMDKNPFASVLPKKD